MVFTDEQKIELESLIHDYIKKNLSVKIKNELSHSFWNDDSSCRTITYVDIYLGDEHITGDWS